MKLKVGFWFYLFLIGLLVPGMLFAQQGTISGKVIDGKSGDPLPGANVLVQGLAVGAATNIEGEFTITGVPVGQRSVIARFIGYKSQIKVVNVTAGEITELNFNLEETVLALDEVVVTGVGVETEKKKLGNTVATINTRALQAAPVRDLSEILQGRTPGVNALPSSGIPGEGTRIRIRGSATVSQSNEPIVYIDGVRVDNSGGLAGNNATFYYGGGGSPSRLDDINPESIERIEILKGAAAATLYGTQANSGIIQIFTKKGSFGKPKFTVEIEQAALQTPDVYHPNAGFTTDGAVDELFGESGRHFGLERTSSELSQLFGIQVRPFEVFERKFVKQVLRTGHGQVYSLSVSGGGSGVTYFVSGRFQRTDGPFNPKPSDFFGKKPGGANDLLRRGQFSANVNLIPSNKLNIRASVLYSDIHQEIPENNNNIFAILPIAMDSKPEVATADNATGSIAFTTMRETTFQENKDDTDHAGFSISTNYKPAKEISVDVTFGLDFVSQRSSTFRPFRWNVDNKAGSQTGGALVIAKREHKEWTLDVKANWNRSIISDISSSFILGFQGFNTNETFSAGTGVSFPGPGLQVLDAGDQQSVESSFEEVIEAGFFLQEQLGFKNYLYVTGGVRFDANSAFGSNFSVETYPKISLSFLPSTAFNWTGSTLSTLRLRAAVGQSGLQPGAFDQFTTFQPFNSSEGPGLAPENLGNEDLKPEKSTEWEAGFEAGLFADKLGLEFTYWNRTVRDALIQRQFPLTGGFINKQLDNIGELKAKGVDIVANLSLIRQENLSVDIFANGAFLDEEVTDLGGAPPLKVGGSYPRYRNFIDEGLPPGAFLGSKLASDLEFPIDITNDNIAESREELLDFFSQPRRIEDFAPVRVDEDGDGDFLDHYLGKPAPDWQGAFGFNVGFMKRFRLSTLFEYKAGNYFVSNLTDAFRKSHPLIGRNIRRSAELESIILNPASTAEQRLAAANEWVRGHQALAPYSGLNQIEKADFIAVREISLSYDFPRNLTRNLGVSNATLTFAIRNLHKFTGYSGIDPETNAIGRDGEATELDRQFLDGTDAWAFALPREFTLKLRFGF